jgi:hypothetical protein
MRNKVTEETVTIPLSEYKDLISQDTTFMEYLKTVQIDAWPGRNEWMNKQTKDEQ